MSSAVEQHEVLSAQKGSVRVNKMVQEWESKAAAKSEFQKPPKRGSTRERTPGARVRNREAPTTSLPSGMEKNQKMATTACPTQKEAAGLAEPVASRSLSQTFVRLASMVPLVFAWVCIRSTLAPRDLQLLPWLAAGAPPVCGQTPEGILLFMEMLWWYGLGFLLTIRVVGAWKMTTFSLLMAMFGLVFAACTLAMVCTPPDQKLTWPEGPAEVCTMRPLLCNGVEGTDSEAFWQEVSRWSIGLGPRLVESVLAAADRVVRSF